MYDLLEDYRKEMKEEVELFSSEKEFNSIKIGYDFIFTITSSYHRELPFPFFWRRFIEIDRTLYPEPK